MAKEKKQEKKKKLIRHDWVKLQEELDLFKIENRGKTLKEFCNIKKISYAVGRLNLKITASKQKANVFDQKRAESFQEAVKKKHPKPVKSRRWIIVKKCESLITSLS